MFIFNKMLFSVLLFLCSIQEPNRTLRRKKKRLHWNMWDHPVFFINCVDKLRITQNAFLKVVKAAFKHFWWGKNCGVSPSPVTPCLLTGSGRFIQNSVWQHLTTVLELVLVALIGKQLATVETRALLKLAAPHTTPHQLQGC